MKTIMILMLCAAFVGCKNLPDLPDLPKIPDIPIPQPDPVPVPEPTPDPEKPKEQVNHGGDGLYKPSTTMWMPPLKNPTNGQRLLAEHVGKAGEFRDQAGTQLVKWLKWPNKIGPMSNQRIDGNHPATGISPDDKNMYHNGRITIRGAKATNSGDWYLLWDVYGQLLFKKQIIDRNVRQE